MLVSGVSPGEEKGNETLHLLCRILQPGMESDKKTIKTHIM